MRCRRQARFNDAHDAACLVHYYFDVSRAARHIRLLRPLIR